MSEPIYVVGGKQRAPRKLLAGDTRTWYEYERGLILQIDPDTEKVEPVLDYVSPPEACGDRLDPQILFTPRDHAEALERRLLGARTTA